MLEHWLQSKPSTRSRKVFPEMRVVFRQLALLCEVYSARKPAADSHRHRHAPLPAALFGYAEVGRSVRGLLLASRPAFTGPRNSGRITWFQEIRQKRPA